MKIKFIYLLIVTLSTTSLFGQSAYQKDLEVARAYTEIGEYGNAIKYYLRCNKKQPTVDLTIEIAYCHIKSREYSKANTFLKGALNDIPTNYIVTELLGDINMTLGNYDLSKTYYQKIKDNPLTDTIAIKRKIASCDSAKKWISERNMITVKNLVSINSPSSEAAPCWYNDGLLFSSTRESIIIKKKCGVDNEPYYDLYYSSYKNDHFTKPGPFSPFINTIDHEVGVTFSEEEDEIYFTRSIHKGYNEHNDDQINHLKLYKANKSALGWSKPEVFMMNDSTSSFGQPTLGHGDKVFIFASNLPGGYGGTDLYICFKVENGWTAPENMGPKINTSQNENFPFLSDEDILYFSSNGHIGFGGYDIYSSRLEKGEWTQPTNLKAPINSSYDDFGYINVIDLGKAYFTSNRTGGIGKEDIYETIIK